DGGDQQTFVARELLAGVRPAEGVHDGHEIVRAEMPLDELARGALDAFAAPEARMPIVDDHHVDPAVERALVALDVGFNGELRAKRALKFFDRDVDEREGGDRLRPAVLEHLKIFLREIADEGAGAVRDERIDLDVINLDLESRLLRLRRGGWDLSGDERRRAKPDDECGEPYTWSHGCHV